MEEGGALRPELRVGVVQSCAATASNFLAAGVPLVVSQSVRARESHALSLPVGARCVVNHGERLAAEGAEAATKADADLDPAVGEVSYTKRGRRVVKRRDGADRRIEEVDQCRKRIAEES